MYKGRENMRSIGKKLKMAREFLELTQEQVASTLDLTRNIVGNIENDKRDAKPEELLKFSRLYGITMEEIVSEDKKVDLSSQVFARGFDSLSDRDQQEILNLIKFKSSYKG